ncbi:MAG: SulP family inorganic anion transporter [Ancalomicrobiaceae bacterium]|nr:SulP family inorganic anion transporter [Ancalomicrobiaceae bacterium]
MLFQSDDLAASGDRLMRARDWVAGLSVAGLMLPEAVAYAGIAGLTPERAILAAIVGALAYAAVGRSRFAIVAPTSSSAAILAATLANFPGDAAEKAILATVSVAFVGCLFAAAAVARLGLLTGFIARPVLRGFSLGLAVTIILNQLPTLTGVEVHAADLGRYVLALAASMPHWHGPSLATGALALVALMLLKRLPLVPGAFLVIAAGTAGSLLLGLEAQGVRVVGPITLVLALPHLGMLSVATLSQLLQYALPLVLILFAESWGTMRSLALQHGDFIEPNRELGALGTANLVAALVQGMPVGAGFSAGSAAEAAGAASRLTAVVAGLGLLVLVVVAAPLIAHLPEPVLAAVVISALAHALDPAPFIRLWRLDRDQFLAIGAAIGVMVFGVVDGMLIAIGFSLVALLRRMASPQIARLGRLGDGREYVDAARHADAVKPEGIAVWRPSEPLFFANAERIFGVIAQASRAEPGLVAIIVSLEETFDLDSTSLEALQEFDARTRTEGMPMRLARVRDHVRDVLARAGAVTLVERASYSVDGAVEATRRELAARTSAAG